MPESVCIRCGKVRIFHRTWKDKAEGRGSMITHIEMVCPDTECQKIVDKKFAEMREKRITSENKRNTTAAAKSNAATAAKSKTA